jgi:phage shock protein A
MEKVYITDEEKKELTNLTDLEGKFIFQLGEIEYQIQNLEEQKVELKKQIAAFKIKRNQLAARLQQKYGEGAINPETWEFIKSN